MNDDQVSQHEAIPTPWIAGGIDQLLSRAVARRIPLPPPPLRRAIRRKAGVTQDELGVLLHKNRASISRYESGAREPRGEDRRAYAEVLRALTEAP